MAHKRKRDWPMITHNYRVYLAAKNFTQLPHAVRTQAEEMRALWNDLVSLWEQQRERYQKILLGSQEVQQFARERDKALDALSFAKEASNAYKIEHRVKKPTTYFIEMEKAARKRYQDAKEALAQAKARAKATFGPDIEALRAQWYQDSAAAVKARELLHWGNAEFIVQGFDVAKKAFFKGLGEPRKKYGPLDTVAFRLRFTGQGKPVHTLFGKKSVCCIDTQPPPEAYAKGRSDSLKKQLCRVTGSFRVAEEDLPFRIMLHRPLPPGAFIKTATLTGSRTQREYRNNEGAYAANWRWFLSFSMEVPQAAKIDAPDQRGTAAIDLNWRVWDDRVRIGFLKDDSGYRKELFFPAYLVDYWRKIQDHQKKADDLTNELKANLAETVWYKEKDWESDLPEEVHSWIENLPKLGVGKLWKLMHFEEEGLIPGDLISQWAKRWSHQDRQRAGIYGHLKRAKQAFYLNLAVSLCKQYTKIIIEDLDLKQLAEKKSDSVALEKSQQYRQLVSLSTCIDALKREATKTRTEIEEKNPAKTTIICNLCGEAMKRSGALYLECPNGHRHDQDENASDNLLVGIPAAGEEREVA